MELLIDEKEMRINLDRALQIAKKASEKPEIVTQSHDLSMDIAFVIEEAYKNKRLSYEAVALSFLISLSAWIDMLFRKIAINMGLLEEDLLN